MTEAGQRQVPVEQLLGQEPRRLKPWRVKLGKLAAWRDWKLPVKLAAVTLVPIVLAIILGLSMLNGQSERSDSYERFDRLTVLSGSISGLLDALQRERTETAVQLTKGARATAELKKARADVDGRIPTMTDAAGKATELDAGIGSAAKETESLLGRLKALRADVTAGKLDVVQSIKEYSAITQSLLKLDGAAAARVSDEALGGTPQALRELAAVKEEVSLQQALVGFGAARGSLAPSELGQVRTAEVRIEDRLNNFFAVASPAERALFDSVVSEPSAQARARLARSVLGELGVSSDDAIEAMSEREWRDSASRVFEQLGTVETRLTEDAAATTRSLVSESRSTVTFLAVLLGLALLLAIFVVFVITRHLLNSLRLLRSSALSLAEHRLPEAVRDIQEGRGTDTSIEPVPVRCGDEIGEVARAFDAVHSQALRLAAEQAGMRTAYSSVFVNLSRRSQSLVQRQLQLIERLEREEEDADQLATLFQLDHLATRMRRNNENLMMLSGSETPRRSGRPVNTTDVLRAAVSEIEQYQRVVVQSPPTTKVVGHAASDLMRLLAELLDNATSFSPPETQVTVATNIGHGGTMTIDVLDKGIGMNAAEVEEANARMAEASSIAMVTSRRMGLFVVGRLASRHGIGVTLYGGKDIEGVRATVIVPEELVIGAGGGPLTSEIPVITDAGPLPLRQPGKANGLPSPRPAAPTETSATNGSAPESAAEISGTALFAPVTDVPAAETGKSGVQQAGDKPLPRRGARSQKNGTKPATGADLPSGKALFKPGTSPLSDWWSAAAAEAAEAAKPAPEKQAESEAKPAPASETTPIFDEMLSVWFRTTGEPQTADSKAEPGKSGQSENDAKRDAAWEFAADANWRTVQEMSQKAEPATLTEAGLPRRQRGEHLLPGSATPAAAEPIEAKPSRAALGRADRAGRDPRDVRGRLSSFQRGVQRGKHHAGKHEAPITDAGGTQGANGAKDGKGAKSTTPNDAAVPKQAAHAAGAGKTPAPDKPEAGTGAGTKKSAAKDGSPLGSEGAFDFSAEEAFRSAKAALDTKPASFTESGLPRRRRGEQLLPGSASAMAKAAPARAAQPERDPNAMRGRLSSFQQGVRRGRNSTTQTTETESKSQENGG